VAFCLQEADIWSIQNIQEITGVETRDSVLRSAETQGVDGLFRHLRNIPLVGILPRFCAFS
jgi:hypothetical protein